MELTRFETQHGKFGFIKDNGTLGFIVNKEHVTISGNKIKPIGFLKDLAEEQWSKVVESYWEGTSLVSYKNYLTNYHDNKQWTVKTATESGKSLMDSLELKEENWLLIKYL